MQEKVKVKSLSCVRLFATPWTAYQAPPSMGFSRQECWSGLPFPSPGDLPNPGIKPRSPALWADALTSEPPGKSSTVTGINGKSQTKPRLNNGLLLLEQSSKFLWASVSSHTKFLSNWLTPSSPPNLTRLSFVKHFSSTMKRLASRFVLFCFVFCMNLMISSLVAQQ